MPDILEMLGSDKKDKKKKKNAQMERYPSITIIIITVLKLHMICILYDFVSNYSN